jgi:DNA-binding MarR family transcriptional regulator
LSAVITFNWSIVVVSSIDQSQSKVFASQSPLSDSVNCKTTTHSVVLLETVFNGVVELFHRLRVVAEQVHEQGELTASKRGILKDLACLGSLTVPQIARSRLVSRQYVQTLVNTLFEQKYIEFVDNPAHQRSPLVRLTPAGKALFEEMSHREAELFSALSTHFEEQELNTAASVLQRLQELLANQQWTQ